MTHPGEQGRIDRRLGENRVVGLNERTAEAAHRDARRLGAMVRETTTQLLRAGRDPPPMLAALQRELKQAVEASRPTALDRH
jgi:hypothetical protein